MKRVIIILMLLIAATALAAERDRQTPAKQPAKSETKPKQDDKKAPEWPRPYKSTEQISADSVVPFPVDI